MDAIECGIVKLPRVPVADNIPGADMPRFRSLWEHIGKRMPRKGRGKTAALDPLNIPVELQTALEALYGHYVKTFEQWQEAGIEVPPCFIVVCNNTSTSKLVYDYVSGFHRQTEEGAARAGARDVYRSVPQLRRERHRACATPHVADRQRATGFRGRRSARTSEPPHRTRSTASAARSSSAPAIAAKPRACPTKTC